MDDAAPSSDIVFEHPLNERVRNLLRMEFLLDQGEFGMREDTIWHSRTAISALLDIINLFARGDLRSEVQKELERILGALQALSERSGVDPSRLTPVVEAAGRVLEELRNSPTGVPSSIRDNELLKAINQRAGIMGGTLAFDVPSYHEWLSRAFQHRRADLVAWFEAFRYMGEATRLILQLLREGADPVEENAPGGAFHTTLDRSTSYQLLRLHVPANLAAFPEISGSRHFVNLRFMRQPEALERPVQVEDDVTFLLQRCVI